MELKFISYGGAFDYPLGNSSAIVKINYKICLIDCGHTVYSSLRKTEKTDEIDYVFITHLHDDHCGSLSSLLIHRKHFSKNKLKIIYPTQAFRKTLHDFLTFTLIQPEKYLDYLSIEETGFADFIDTKNRHIPGMQTFSYIFREENETVIYSGDLEDSGYLKEKLSEKGISSGIIFHDVTFNRQNKAHAYYKDVEKLMGNFEVWGYHNNPDEKPDDCRLKMVAESSRFLI
jgi:ribonuclease BN (tRNA processing enzyme)